MTLPVEDDEETMPAGPDPVGVVAVVLGLVGIVAAGIVLAIVTSVLGAVAGQRAREERRSYDLAYTAFVLGALDGVVWIVLHYLYELPLAVG